MTMKIGMEMKMESTFTVDGIYSLIDLHIRLYLYDFLAFDFAVNSVGLTNRLRLFDLIIRKLK